MNAVQTNISSRLKRIKNKYYDFGTKNTSFKQIALTLQHLGVKDYYFMLEVCDPRVLNIDPYSENITKDEINIVITECVRNLWYFLREISLLPEEGGSVMHYSAHRGNIAQAWCILHGYDCDLAIPRQCGKTQSAIALCVWAYLFGTTNSQMILLNKDLDASKTNLGRMKKQLDLLPKWLRFESVYSDENGKITKEQKNATSLTHPATKNSVVLKGKAMSQSSALNIARGLTAPILYFDEFEFTEKIDVIVANSAPVFATSSLNAKKNNALYGRIFTSTPGDLDTPAGKAAYEKLVSKMPKWSDQLYNKTHEEIKEYIETNGKDGNDILYIEFSYKQIGKDESWFNYISKKIGDPLTVKREVLMQRMRGSDNSPYSRDDIDYLINNVKRPIEELFVLDIYKFDIYEPLDRKTPYIVGVDNSTGTNGDNNAIMIINPYTLCVAGEFKCPYIGETKYEKLLIELVIRYIPRAIVCIERNSMGDGIIDHLMYSKIASRLYYDKNRDLVESNLEDLSTIESVLKKEASKKLYYGVFTGLHSREDMFTILHRHVHEFKHKMYTANLVDDICHLIVKPSGKIEAIAGSHDDCVMAYLIALYVYYHGNNLAVFGFEKGSDEIKEQNKGLKRIDEISNPEDLVPRDVLEALKREEQAKSSDDYDKMYVSALLQSQIESQRLAASGLIDLPDNANNVSDASFEALNDEDSIPMSFILSLNDW